MKIGITSNYPYVFVLSLAHILKLSGSVNIKTDGLYKELLFDGSDMEQERDGIFFNVTEPCDYELIVNGRDSCDYRIIHFRPIYRELLNISRNNPTFSEDDKHIVLAAELFSSDMRYGKKFFAETYNLPNHVKYFESILEEKDLTTDYYFGMRPVFALDRTSKAYQSMLLNIYNVLHQTDYTKIKQIKYKEVI